MGLLQGPTWVRGENKEPQIKVLGTIGGEIMILC